jgi:nicotinamide-nucleotide adenylyltransferase
MIDTGFIHGRFQVLHNDHIKYLLAGKKRCRHLVVGISNPDPTHTRQDEADPSRSSEAANPLTYYERFVMVREALMEAGLSLDDFTVVPFPINFPDLYRYYIPKEATFFLTIYDEWGEKKLSMFQSLGLKTEILWRRSLAEKGLSSSALRKLIASGGEWQHLVPRSVAQLIETWNLAQRLQQFE